MNKDIKYSGYSAVPSDYECPDGELAQSVNLINEDGALHPILPPHVKLTLSEDYNVLFIHHPTSSVTNYIVFSQKSYKLGWIKDGATSVTKYDESYYNITHLNAVGNVLIVFCSNATYYYLWKNNSYTYLGDHVPNIELSFGLVGHPRLFSMVDDDKSTFKVTFAEKIADSDIHSTFTTANKTSITSQVMAKLNRFIANETINKGRFCFPFFVRYALRMYDGSLICHSAPILMNPQTKPAPVVMWNRLKGKKSSYTEAEMDIMMVAATLDYKVVYSSDWYLIEKWKDLIKSIDVFISKPIYTYDQDGEITSFYDSDNFDTKFIGRLYNEPYSDTSEFVPYGSSKTEDCILGPATNSDFLKYYAEWGYDRIYAMYFNQERLFPSDTIHLPEFSDDKNMESLRSCSTFYKLCSLDINDVYNNRTTRNDIVVDDEYLQSLVTREVMTDDYLSHDNLHVDYSFAYNNRLNLAGVRRSLFKGFSPLAMFAFCNDTVSFKYDSSNKNQLQITSNGNSTVGNKITVYIKENGEDYSVTKGMHSVYDTAMLNFLVSYTFVEHKYTDGKEVYSYSGLYKYSWGAYLFYPNTNAYKIAITGALGTLYIDLVAHDFLNGAYALLDYETTREDNSSTFTPPSITPEAPSTIYTDIGVVDVPNKVYTSEINNPFYFPVTGINTVGTGKILGICSAAKALSQGQFGQFPLYAFTDEGIWAMEVSSTGTYSAKQPITRDVCINSKSITQIDSAVLFATDRGIMLISGSQTQCLTDILNAPDVFDINNLPGLSKLYPQGVPYIDCTFAEYLSSSLMSYDYVNQRIVLFNPQKEYAYVYSMKSKLWGIMKSQLISAINSYPDALAMATDGENNILVDIGRTDADSAECLLVTRPLKLDSPDILKTMDTIIQRGYFQKGHVQSVLYGSRDLYNWHLLWSSKDHYLRGFRGTPYKYFRIALLCNLSQDENIFGASLQFSPRQINQPR